MLRISVIVPAYNASATLAQALAALSATDPQPHEIIIVDDGSSDDTASLAESFGVRVARLGQNRGAASAKNLGARAATGDLLFFTDSDIVVQPDVIRRLSVDFCDDERDGVIGLLDEAIPVSNFASQFKNLWMNFTYTRLAHLPRVGLFYTSVAAIRRDTFLQAGGFDEHYRGASIAEDTEFGQRAWGQGVRIALDGELQVVHLKSYSLVGVLREDLFRARALTLMRLRKWGQPFFTSVPAFYQLAVPVLYLALACGAAALLLQNAFWLVFAALALATFYLLNIPLLRFLLVRRGLAFAVAGALLLPLDVLVVGIGMLIAVLDFARGERY